jgi:3-methylfumaryl-CoA hydratase
MTDVIERTETPQPEVARALGDLLGAPVPEPGAGLPPLWHWVYLLDRAPQADLGPDGHPVRGTLPAPPGPGRRRMWAGGRVRTSGALRCGIPATKRTTVLSVTEKDGRSGHLTFVTVGVRVRQDGAVVVEEEQDIVYRDAAPAASAPPPKAPSPIVPVGAGEREIEVTPTLLFRFSALTYNAHRIHYDLRYARGEGYPGLVVHGPLQALLMAEQARPVGSEYSYRLVAPLYEDQGLIVSAAADGDAVRVSCRDTAGRVTATGVIS